jgi:hypothetical protein
MRSRYILAVAVALLVGCCGDTSGQETGGVLMPASAVIVMPDNLDLDMTDLQQALRQADEPRIQQWARNHSFLCKPIKARCYALLHVTLARPLQTGCQTLIDLMQDDSLKPLSQLDAWQVEQLSRLLQTPSFTRVVLSNFLKQAFTRGARVGIKPLTRLQAVVSWDRRDYTIDLKDLTPLAKLEELPPAPQFRQQQDALQGRNLMDIRGEWTVIVLDLLADPKAHAEWTAKAFQLLAEEIAKDAENALALFEDWRRSVANRHIDSEQQNWVAWDALSAEQRQQLREALIGRHIDQERVFDESLLDSAEWGQRVRVRFQIAPLLQMLTATSSGEATLLLIPLGKDGGPLEAISNPQKLADF